MEGEEAHRAAVRVAALAVGVRVIADDLAATSGVGWRSTAADCFRSRLDGEVEALMRLAMALDDAESALRRHAAAVDDARWFEGVHLPWIVGSPLPFGGVRW